MFRYITVPSIRPSLIVVLDHQHRDAQGLRHRRTATGGNFNTSRAGVRVLPTVVRLVQQQARRGPCGDAVHPGDSIVFTTSVRCAGWRHDEHRDHAGGPGHCDCAVPTAASVAHRSDVPVGVVGRDHHRHHPGRSHDRPVHLLVPARGGRQTSGWWTWFSNPTVTLENYHEVLYGGDTKLATYFVNSIVIAIPSVIIRPLATLAAYAFAWMKFPVGTCCSSPCSRCRSSPSR
jgi:hypothetical protein